MPFASNEPMPEGLFYVVENRICQFTEAELIEYFKIDLAEPDSKVTMFAAERQPGSWWLVQTRSNGGDYHLVRFASDRRESEKFRVWDVATKWGPVSNGTRVEA